MQKDLVFLPQKARGAKSFFEDAQIAPKTETEFLERFQGQVDALLGNPCMFGFCYTQLTDVEQEQNGLYTYDRKAKFEPAKIRKILSREAAIEKK